MRHLLAIDIPGVFRRNRSVEQFLGRSPAHPGYLRFVELRPSDESIEVWVHDVEDVGDEDALDLYAFPYLEPDGPEAPLATVSDPQAAVDYASTALAADPARWFNAGVAQSEYLDFIRAGRPARWPL